jgi:hypothetical protein
MNEDLNYLVKKVHELEERLNKKLEERFAKVINNNDPLKKGRIKATIYPELFDLSEDKLNWIYPHINHGGGGEKNSTHSIPEIGEFVKVVILDPHWKHIEYIHGDYVENYYPYENFKSIVADMKELGSQTYPQPAYIKSYPDGSFSFHNTVTGEHGFYNFNKAYILFDAKGNIITKDVNANTITNDDKGIDILDVNGNEIKLDSNGIDILDLNANDIKMTSSGIDIKDSNSNEIKLTSSGIDIKNSSGTVEIQITSSGITLKGPTVSIGTVATPPTGLCGLPVCLFAGINHTTNSMPGT